MSVTQTDLRVKYDWSVKTTAVTKYLALNNLRLVSELVEVPYDTLLEWKKQDWWLQIADDIKRLRKTNQGKKLTEIIEIGVEVVQDRLKNGDYFLNNKTGEVGRKPVSLRDAANVTNQLLTRQLQLEELAERMETRTESVNDTLTLLAKEFSKWNRINNRKQSQEIDFVEVIDAIHEGREEGLQARGAGVHEQTGSSQEKDSAERSSS